MGLEGIILTIAASPDLTNLGASSILEYVSIFQQIGEGDVLLAGTTVNLLQEFGKFAGNVGGVAIQDWSVSSTDLTRVVEDDDLGVEGLATLGGVVLRVTAHVTTTDFLDGNVLDVESDVVSWETFNQSFVVHFNTTLLVFYSRGKRKYLLTSVVTLAGAKVTTIPALMIPVSTRPTGTVPIPPILYTS